MTGACFRMADYPHDPEGATIAAARYATANRGETVSVEVPVYRRWWQIWKPRVVATEFVLIGVGHEQFYHWTMPVA